jgi:hypothetical protein
MPIPNNPELYNPSDALLPEGFRKGGGNIGQKTVVHKVKTRSAVSGSLAMDIFGNHFGGPSHYCTAVGPPMITERAKGPIASPRRFQRKNIC